MKLQIQETYKYFYEDGKQGSDVKIERICMGNAYATSEAVGDMGPFTMCFNTETGKGMGDYEGTYLEEYPEGEIVSTEYEATVSHSQPHFKAETVLIKVREGEEIFDVAKKAFESKMAIFDKKDGYNIDSIVWKRIN